MQHYRYEKRCDTCKLGDKTCVYIKFVKAANTTNAKKVRDMVCQNCPCRNKYGGCFRDSKTGCKNHEDK